MIIQSFDVCRYVKPGDQATIGIGLEDHTFFEAGVVVREVNGDDLLLELLGELPAGVEAAVGAQAMLIKKDSLALCRCHMLLSAPLSEGVLRCRVADEVEIHQRREYFRLDVAIPFRWQVPEDQRLSSAIDHWSESRVSIAPGESPRLTMTVKGGFRVLNWRGETLEPQAINLSGGGLRCKLPLPLAVGTLLNLELFLPLTPGRVIHGVGVVVRSTELQLTEEKGPAHLTGINFVHLADEDRETIISFIFNQQRQQLRAYAEER